MARFEASYDPGEDNERRPVWVVVEWEHINSISGAKTGRAVWKSYDMMDGEREAHEMAAIFQHEYNMELAGEFA